MTAAEYQDTAVGPRDWEQQTQTPGQSVETLELRSGASLTLSRFGRGSDQSFRFTEPEDTFGFGFHLKGGARFELENGRFETNASDVWTSAAPAGSTSLFILPSDGFKTVSLRFKPQIAEEFLAEGLALPKSARNILRHAHESVGFAQLPPLTPLAASRVNTMFTTAYDGPARRLFLESCALELLAGQIASLSASAAYRNIDARHREKALAAREHLDAEFQEPPTIAELSKIVGTNEFTLKRAFKETVGMTIFAYISRRRMAHATRLLQQGMSVTATAHAVGYGCPRSFSAAFRRQIGQSPSALRRKVT